jgi:Fe-S cluster assembly protein SufD
MTDVVPSGPETQYLAAFDRLKGRAKDDWLMPAREAAMARFRRTGLPQQRLEAWKYTDLRRMLEGRGHVQLESDQPAKISPSARTLPCSLFEALAPLRLVFVNGRFEPALSALAELPKGVEVAALAPLEGQPTWLRENLTRLSQTRSDAVIDLNTGLMQFGIAVYLRAGVRPERPIELYMVDDRAAAPPSFLRNLLVLEEAATLTLLEHYTGMGDVARSAGLANITSEISLKANAVLTHLKVQEEHRDVHLSSYIVRLGSGAVYDSAVLSRGGMLVREQAFIDIAELGARAFRRAAFLSAAAQHHDHSVVIDHRAGSGESCFLSKHVLKDEAHAVAQGHSIVYPGAQKSEANQLIRALLLNDRTEMDAKPQLEIYADDVKCAHGASSGALDEDALFYLRTRGIPEPEARSLLVRAFLEDSLLQWTAFHPSPDILRETAATILDGWLADWSRSS